MWFAALFGLGSLAASAEALGALVVHLHLPAILSAASPPLGMTARLVLGIVLAGLGGTIGLMIGLVLYIRAGGVLPQRPIRAEVAPQADPVVVHDHAPRVRSRDAHPDAPPRRPLVVTEDVLPYPTSMVEPVSAPAPNIDAHLADDDHHFDHAHDHADLPPFLAAAMSAVQQERDQAPIFVGPTQPIIVPADTGVAEHELAEHEQAVAEAPVAPASPPPLSSPPSLSSPPPLASLAAAAPKVALDELPLASLGLVQLIERLALAIAARQALRAAALAAPRDAVDPRMPLHRFDPLTMDPSGPLLRAKKTRDDPFDTAIDDLHDGEGQSGAPHALLHDPLAQVADWHDDHAADALPPRFLGQPVAAIAPTDIHAADTADDEIEAMVEHRYSSLADMALPRPELLPFVVPVEPDHAHAHADAPAPTSDPVVPFPSRLSGGESLAHPQPSNDADRALREALATLRQMSAQR